MFVGVLVVAGGVGAGGWYLINDWLGASPNGEVPLIRADSSPIKVRPKEPGGMNVPDRDKLVYDKMDGNDQRDKVEHLLPPPQTPLPKPAPAPGTTPVAPQASASAPVTATAPTASTQPVPPPPPPPVPSGKPGVPTASAPATPAPAPQKAVPSVQDVLTAMRPPPPVEAKKQPVPAEPAPKAAPAKTTVATKGGAYQVQLSALRNRDRVETEWNRLRKRNSDLLGNLKLSVMRADLGPGKGVFYRLRAGPLADEQAAKDLCQKLSARKVGCLVVRPEG